MADAALERMLTDLGARLARLEAGQERLLALVDRADRVERRVHTVADAAGGIASAAWEAAEERGIDAAEVADTALALGTTMLTAAERIHRSGLDLERVVERGAVVATRLSEVLVSPEFERLLDSGALDAGSASAMTDLGKYRLLGKLGDVDVQTALGFGLGVASRLGRRLRQ